MQRAQGQILYSPSDLITFMGSPFGSWMDRKALDDPSLKEKMDPEDGLMKTLQGRGYAHEAAYLKKLKADGLKVEEVARASPQIMAAETLRLMQEGVDVIAQGYLAHDNFAGLSDFLVRIPGASLFGDFHYEVWDTKLSKKLKPYFAIQLCAYAQMLETIQGRRPDQIAVVLGSGEKRALRVDDYFAYFLGLKQSFLDAQARFDPQNGPDPVMADGHGRWNGQAEQILQARDYLGAIAGIRLNQITKLERAGIMTLTDLAKSDRATVPKMAPVIFGKLRAQAAIQLKSRGLAIPAFEITPQSDLNQGLHRLPDHSPLDVFFDIEGYPLDGGLEYLWGCTHFDEAKQRSFRDFWAHDSAQEKQAFVDFISWIYERWKADPSMHVYHYASYEITALNRLRKHDPVSELKVDNLLRNNVFVDLYTVVKNSILLGEDSYSIKKVEHLYRPKRATQVTGGGDSVVAYEAWRETPDGETWESSGILKDIRDYNIDDCDSTQELTNWLRVQKQKLGIQTVAQPMAGEVENPEEATEITALRDKVLQRSDTEDDAERKRMMRTLAWSLDFHRREQKPSWWRYFERSAKDEAELYDDPDCIAGLVRTDRPAFLPTPRSKSPVHEYRFDRAQEFKEGPDKFSVLNCLTVDGKQINVTVEQIDAEASLIQLKSSHSLPSTLSLIPNETVGPGQLPEAIKQVLQTSLDSDFAPSAIVDFLSRARPRIKDNPSGPVLSGEGDRLAQIIDAVKNLQGSYLTIQGPPGAGKTYTAKHVINALLASGKNVGITSNSHKAILNLMRGVDEVVQANGTNATLYKHGGEKDDALMADTAIKSISDVVKACDDLLGGGVCLGATAWGIANKALEPSQANVPCLDYLFVDEAGQVSVANLIAMSRAAKNIVLMGDQMQLGQPTQGVHPEDSGLSCLDYLMGETATIPEDLGVFLPVTHRMHPDVCAFISNQVYDGRLGSDAVTNKHLVDTSSIDLSAKAGIVFLPVVHEGNTQSSDEEVEVIRALTEQLIGLPLWPGEKGQTERKVGWKDILFVAPYNYQGTLLRRALGPSARVGSVDRFQGQEAPIVILSMCASSATESPRGIDFLFSKNRLNVAISRAQALAIVVGNPDLALTPVSNLKQLALVNMFAALLRAGIN